MPGVQALQKAMVPLVLFLATLVAPPAGLSALTFISGHWRGQELDGTTAIEEVWSKPSGDSMIGMFRTLTGGKTRMAEFMAIEQRKAGRVLVMRHFSPGLIARKGKDAPLVWTLEKVDAGNAVFLIEKDGMRLEFLLKARTPTITLEINFKRQDYPLATQLHPRRARALISASSE